jgi:phosphatidylethanolamine-binding protein (PEBP) family uncharacterized protein
MGPRRSAVDPRRRGADQLMRLSAGTRNGDVRRALVASAIVAGLVAAGCGASSPKSPTAATAGHIDQVSTQTSRQSKAPPGTEPANAFNVSIPTYVRENEHLISSRYTCDGADISLPVRWSGVPRGTEALALFVVNVRPADGKLFFDWAVAGLNPTSHGISAGTLPPGAIVGRNSFGNTSYSICPAKGPHPEHFFVKVASLPRPLAVKPGFDAEALYREAERTASVIDYGGGAYKRQ